jgi:hypothetical protein
MDEGVQVAGYVAKKGLKNKHDYPKKDQKGQKIKVPVGIGEVDKGLSDKGGCHAKYDHDPHTKQRKEAFIPIGEEELKVIFQYLKSFPHLP